MNSQIPINVLYIWYLFNQINQGQPFSIQVPVAQRSLALLILAQELNETLTKYKVKGEHKLVQLYKENSDTPY